MDKIAKLPMQERQELIIATVDDIFQQNAGKQESSSTD